MWLRHSCASAGACGSGHSRPRGSSPPGAPAATAPDRRRDRELARLDFRPMPRLELVETSLRHGQQALLVSRLRRRHAVAVAEPLDHCGFAALDVFGGATFEASLRFLAEDPF